jgi:protein SCO1/2
LCLCGCARDVGDEEPTVAELHDWREIYEAWEEPAPLPDFALVDQDGERFRLQRFRDDYLLVGFVFARCQLAEACPLTMAKMRAVQKAWSQASTAPQSEGKTLSLLTVTLDPEFDTPAVLKRFAEGHGADFANWTLATGPNELVSTALPSLFNVMALPNGKGSLNHSVKVALLRPGLTQFREWRDNKFQSKEIIDLVQNDQGE